MMQIRNTTPYHTEKNVSRDRSISVRFFSDMNEDTFNRNTIMLFNTMDQRTEMIHLTYSNKILEIKPIELLQPNTHYKLMITGGELGVRDIVDIPMAESYSMEFFTKESEELKPPIIIEPIHRTIVDMPITIKMQGDKEASYIRLQLSDSHDFSKIIYPINEQLIASQGEVSLTPDIQLKEGTYYLRAASLNEEGIQTSFSTAIQFYTDGNYLEEVLTPEPPEEPIDPEEPEIPEESETPEESEEPSIEDIINEEIPDITDEEEEEVIFKVLGLKPKQDMTHVPITEMKTIIIRFSEDIDLKSVTSESVYVVAEKN